MWVGGGGGLCMCKYMYVCVCMDIYMDACVGRQVGRWV